MIKKISIIVVYLFTFLIVSAQGVSDYYHSAANLYIKGSKKAAMQVIQDALKKYPNDLKLKQLSGKVKKLPEDEENKNKNKKQEQNQKQDQNQKQNQDQKEKQQKNQPQQSSKPQSQMSKQNAQQILDALQQDEKNAQDKAKKPLGRGTRKAERDW